MMSEDRHREGSRRHRERSRVTSAARILEGIGGGLLCVLGAMTPWLFGTTEEWSVRLMNIGSYSAGAFIATAAILNRFSKTKVLSEQPFRERLLAGIFLILNLAVLAFCAIALWNARAEFAVIDRSFSYRDDYNPRLPTTYDAPLTAEALASLTGCFVAFWSLRYWIFRGHRRSAVDENGILSNKRFQLVLWVLTMNGMALATQGVLQRLSGSGKLLWVRDSWSGLANACFGPFSYRGNAAEYLNLIWPVAVGFWWVLSRERRRRTGASRMFTDGPELLLLPATVMMVTACFITLSRGGVLIASALLGGIGLMLFLQKNVSIRARVGFVAFIMVVALAVWFFAGTFLKTRFEQAGLSDLSGREEIYRNAKQMAADYPIFGTGPGTFRSVYHLYRQDTEEAWHGFLHDDWMETLVTFGRVGFALVAAHLLFLGVWLWSAGRPGILYVFPACASFGLAGTLVHAKFDFPFQTYSILFTFVLICGVLTSVSSTRRGGSA
jgi:O-antigen ligase